MRRIKWCVAAAVAAVWCGAGAVPEVHVSPKGDDTTPGTREAPLATAAGALRLVRERRAAGSLPSGSRVRILFGEGRYALTEPISLTAADSHLELCASGPGAVVFSGGRELPPFRSAGGGLWRTHVPDGFVFEQLWVDGVRAVRARSPNEFYLYAKLPVEEGIDPDTGNVADLSRRAFVAYADDLAPLAALPYVDLGRVVVRHFHSWDSSMAYLRRIDLPGGTVIEMPSRQRNLFTWPQNEPRYVLENFRAALDAPGEWFLDVNDSTLWYMPRPCEDVARARAVAPVADRLLVAVGDRRSGRPVRDVVLSGLAFEYAGYRMPAEGQASGQAAIDVHDAVRFADAEDVVLESCRFERLAPHGVHFGAGTRAARMSRCAVKDLGGSAVRIGEPELAGVERIEVVDCILQSGGRIFTGAVGVWIGKASRVSLVHNDIGDFLYTGVSMGWTWGYAETGVHDNLIAWNHIHHIGQGVLSDAGGIYTLGRAPGTKVIGNRIHDVYSYDYTGRGGWGLYTDEGSAEMLFESNLVYRVKTGAIHQHYGRDNVFRNNILAYSMENMVQRSRLEDHRTITVEGNILYWDNSTAAVTGGRKAPGVAPDMAFARNLYWSTAGVATNAFLGVPFAAWQAAGQDEGSRIADPLFADPAKGDFDLRADSPAFMLGFRAFDWRRAGVRGDASWRAEAAACDPGEVRFAPPPRPVEPSCSRAGVDFERFGASGGRGPAFFRLSIGRSKEAHIRPTDRHAHSGRWSLELKDSPDLAAPYQPHLYRFMTAKDGVVQISFAMKCGAGAVVHFLLRDYHPEEGGEYAGGPGFRAEHGRVLAGGETVAFAPGTWLTADVRLDFKTRTWTLVLTPDGGKATSVGPLDFPKHFVRLDWIGFTTDAPDAATWWLDDFTYSHDAMEE